MQAANAQPEPSNADESTDMGDSPKILGPCNDFGPLDDGPIDASTYDAFVDIRPPCTSIVYDKNVLNESGVDVHDSDQSGQTAATDVKSEFSESADSSSPEDARSPIEPCKSASLVNDSMSPNTSSAAQAASIMSPNSSYMSKLEVSQSDSSLNPAMGDIFADTLDGIADLPETQSITTSVQKFAMEMKAEEQATSSSSAVLSTSVSPDSDDDAFISSTYSVHGKGEPKQPTFEKASIGLEQQLQASGSSSQHRARAAVGCTNEHASGADSPSKGDSAHEPTAKSTAATPKVSSQHDDSSDESDDMGPSESDNAVSSKPAEDAGHTDEKPTVPEYGRIVQHKLLEVAKVQQIRSSPRRSSRAKTTESTPKKSSTPSLKSLFETPILDTPRRARAAKNAACVSISALCVKGTPTKKGTPKKADAVALDDTPRRTRAAARSAATPSVSTLAKETPAAAMPPATATPKVAAGQASAATALPVKAGSPQMLSSTQTTPTKKAPVAAVSTPVSSAAASTSGSPFKTPYAVSKASVKPYAVTDMSPNKTLSQPKSPFKAVVVRKLPYPTASPNKPSTLAHSNVSPVKMLNQPMLKSFVPSPSHQQKGKMAMPMRAAQSPQNVFAQSPARVYAGAATSPNKLFPVNNQSPYKAFPVTRSPAYSRQQSPVKMFAAQSPQKKPNTPFAFVSTSPYRSPMNGTPLNSPHQGVTIVTPEQKFQLSKELTVIRISPPTNAMPVFGKDLTVTRISPPTNGNAGHFMSPQNGAQYVHIQNGVPYVQQQSPNRYVQVQGQCTPNKNGASFVMTPRQSARLRQTPQAMPCTPKNLMMTPQQQSSVQAHHQSMSRTQLVGLQITAVASGVAACSAAAYNQTPVSAQRSAQPRGRNLTASNASISSGSPSMATPKMNAQKRGQAGALPKETSIYVQEPMKPVAVVVATPPQPLPKDTSSKRTTKRQKDDLRSTETVADSDAESNAGRPKRNARNQGPSAAVSDKPKRGGQRKEPVAADSSTESDTETKAAAQEPQAEADDKPTRGRRAKQAAVEDASTLSEPTSTDDMAKTASDRPKRLPRKGTSHTDAADKADTANAKEVAADAKPKRGRPPKSAVTENGRANGETAPEPSTSYRSNGYTGASNLEPVDMELEPSGNAMAEKPKRGQKKVAFSSDVVEAEAPKRGGRSKRAVSTTDKSDSDGEALKPAEKPKRGRPKRVDSVKSETDGEVVVESGAEKSSDEEKAKRKRGRPKSRILFDADVIDIESDASQPDPVPVKRRANALSVDSSDDAEPRYAGVGRRKKAAKLDDLLEEPEHEESTPVKRAGKRKKADPIAAEVSGTPAKQAKLAGNAPVEVEPATTSKRGKQPKMDEEPVSEAKPKRGTKRSAKTTSDDDDEPAVATPKQKKTTNGGEAEATVYTRSRRRAK